MSAMIRAGVWGVGILITYYVGKYVYHLIETKFLKDPVRQHPGPGGNFDGQYITTCLVCIEELSSNISLALPCKHKFHIKCLQELFRHEPHQRICPSCRRSISEEFIQRNFRLK